MISFSKNPEGGGRGLEEVIFYKESKSQKKFFFWGGGRGEKGDGGEWEARVSEFFVLSIHF